MRRIANVTKFAGTTISKIPGIKNGNVDEKLIEKSESLKEYASKKIF